MDSTELIVTAAGLALIVFIVWYFFLSSRAAVSAVSSAGGVQEVDITVKGGYTPDVIEVERGKPVQLNFFRDEEATCSEELVFPEFHIRRELPAYQTTLIELLPEKKGIFEFTCGMHMLRGKLVVK